MIYMIFQKKKSFFRFSEINSPPLSKTTISVFLKTKCSDFKKKTMSTINDSCTGMNDSTFGFGTFKRFENECKTSTFTDINEAAYSGDVEAVESFVTFGVNPGTFVDNVLKNSPLHAACEGGHISVVNYLYITIWSSIWNRRTSWVTRRLRLQR